MVSDLVKKIGLVVLLGAFSANTMGDTYSNYITSRNGIKVNGHITKENSQWKLKGLNVKGNFNVGDVKKSFSDKTKSLQIPTYLLPTLKKLAVLKYNHENVFNETYLSKNGNLVAKGKKYPGHKRLDEKYVKEFYSNMSITYGDGKSIDENTIYEFINNYKLGNKDNRPIRKYVSREFKISK